MKNFKKALALVLAAATAFTFAPVANLGSAVEAEAKTADVQQTFNMPSEAYSNSVTTGSVATESKPGYSDISWAREKNGIVIEDFQVVTKSTPGNVFKVAHAGDLTGYDTKDEKDATNSGNKIYSTSEHTATESGASNSNGFWAGASGSGKYLADNLYIKSESDGVLNLGDIYVSSKGTHRIELVDQNTKDGETLRIDISAAGVKEEYPAVSIIPLKFTKNSGTFIAANNYTNGVADKLSSQTSTYFLDLNKYNPGYMIAYNNNGHYDSTTPANTTAGGAKDGLVYTNWAGQTIAISKIVLTGSNRSIQWATPDTTTNAVKDPLEYQRSNKVELDATSTNTYMNSTVASTTTSQGQNTVYEANGNYAIFKTTAPTVTTDKIDVTFTGDNSYDVSDAIVFSTDKSENAVDSLSITDTVDDTYKTVYKKSDYTSAANYPAEYHDAPYYVTGLDRKVHNTGTLKVKSESSNVTFKSGSPSIVEIDEKTGKFTVKDKGVALINIYTLGSTNNKDAVTTVAFDVNAYSTDAFKVSDSANAIYRYLGAGDYLLDMDIPTQTASNKLVTDTLQVQSLGGLKVKYTSSDPSVATVNETTGVIETKKAGDTTITAKTETDTTNGVEIWGNTVAIKVTVWTLPAVDFDVAPITLGVTEEKVVSPVFKDTTTQFTYSVNYNQVPGPDEYKLTNPNGAQLSNDQNTQTSSKVTGAKAGQSSLQVTVIGITGKYRPTTKVVAVNVTDKAAANVITVADDSKSVIMKVGDTKQLSATATLKNTVTFKSNNDAIVTATSGGAITAVSNGSTTITVSADGAESVEIPVIVNSQDNNEAVAPAKVTGLKVSNKKGAHVSVKWTSQGKNINYRIWKKVGNGKWVGKNVAGSKTTLSVKKGAKVQVKVKAYVKDSNGKTTWGPKATKAKTFKTDKK